MIAVLAGTLGAVLRRGAIAGGRAAAAAALVLAGFGCAMAAVWIALAPEIGQAGAAAVVAAGFLLPGLGLLFWPGPRRAPSTVPSAATTGDAAQAGAMAAELLVLARANPGTAVLAALVAGMMVGRKS